MALRCGARHRRRRAMSRPPRSSSVAIVGVNATVAMRFSVSVPVLSSPIDLDRAERLDRVDLAHQHLALAHVLDAERERRRRDGGQPLRDGGDRERDRAAQASASGRGRAAGREPKTPAQISAVDDDEFALDVAELALDRRLRRPDARREAAARGRSRSARRSR